MVSAWSELYGLLLFSGDDARRPDRIYIFDNTSSQTAPLEGALTPPGKKDGMVHSILDKRQTKTQRKWEKKE